MQSPQNTPAEPASTSPARARRDLSDPKATFEDLPYKPQLTPKQAKRANQTFKGMVLSLLFTLAAVIPILLMNPLSSGEQDRSVDLQQIAQQAAPAADFTPWAPQLGDDEYANFARWQTSALQDVSYWEFGLVFEERDFVWVRQVSNAQFNASWLAALTDNAAPTDTLVLDGVQWEQREKDGEVYLIGQLGDSTLVLSSDTSEQQLLSVAQAAVQQVK